jgi:hypothetical protein
MTEHEPSNDPNSKLWEEISHPLLVAVIST